MVLRCAVAMLAAVALGACGTVHSVRPLGKGNTALSLDLGGPPLGEIGDAPLPMIDLGIRHGIDDRSDVWAVVHLLPLVLDRVPTIGADVGISRQLLSQSGPRPAIGLGVTTSVLVSPAGGYAHLDVPVAISWMVLQERWLHYLGFHGTLFLTGYEVLSIPPVAFAPFIGTEIRIGPKREFGIGGEITWHQPWLRNTDAVLDWHGIGGFGALSFQLTFRVYPQRKPKETPA